MSDDIISSSDDETTSRKITKKGYNATKNVILTKDTLLQYSKILLSSVSFQEIKNNESIFFDTFKQNPKYAIYCRLNDVLCIDKRDLNNQNIKLIGLYTKDKLGNDILKDTNFNTEINLFFVCEEDIPDYNSIIFLVGRLNESDDMPLVSVYCWKYITEHFAKSLDECLYNYRTIKFDKKPVINSNVTLDISHVRKHNLGELDQFCQEIMFDDKFKLDSLEKKFLESFFNM